MSTLNVSNISDGTDTVETGYVVNGSAKAWVNLNGTGTIAIRDSQNVSGLVDNGTGDYQTNFTNNFAVADYATSGAIRYNAGVAFDGVFTMNYQGTGHYIVYSVYGGTLFDSTIVTSLCTGDLA